MEEASEDGGADQQDVNPNERNDCMELVHHRNEDALVETHADTQMETKDTRNDSGVSHNEDTPEAQPGEHKTKQQDDEAQIAKKAISDIFTEHEFEVLIDTVNSLKSTTKQSTLTSLKKKLVKVTELLHGLELNGDGLEVVRQERDAEIRNAEVALQKLETLSQSILASEGRHDKSNEERENNARLLQRKESAQQIVVEANSIEEQMVEPFDDVTDSEMFTYIDDTIKEKYEKLKEINDEQLITHEEFYETKTKLKHAIRKLKEKAYKKEQMLKMLQEKCAALSRSRESMEKMGQGLAYLEGQINKFYGTSEARGYRFLEDQLTGMMRNLDRLEIKDDDEIRPLYEASIAEAQRVLKLLEHRAALQVEEREAESAETCMLELNSILDELNSIPDGGINETQYQHLQYKVHTASSELENLTEEAVTREIRETAAKLVQEAYEKLELKLPKQHTDQASSSQARYERPLQLLYKDDKGVIRLDEEALRSVVCQESVRHRKLVVLSVVGEFRRGKSFLLNFMVRYLRAKCADDWLEAESQESLEGFMWRRGTDPVTQGILIWPEAFLFDNNLAVVLLDTQGTFDMNSRMEFNVFLFALSSLVSSIQILNIHERFQMDALTQLQYFVEYGNAVAKESKKEAFQKLLILVRDWSFPDELEFGFKGGDQYWIQEHQKQEDISKSLINCYENIECFLMPYPGDTVAKNQEFRGALRDIDGIFIKNMKTLIENVLKLENLVPKRVGLSYISAENFISVMKTFLENLQHSEYRKPATLFEMTAKLHHEESMSAALEFYTSHMIKNMPLTADVTKLHKDAETKAKNLFINKKRFGQTQLKNEYVTLLNKKLETEYKRLVIPFMEEQKRQHKAGLQKTLEDAIHSHREALSSCLHGPDYHKFYLIDKQERTEAKSKIAKVTGYIKPQRRLESWKENIFTSTAKLENEKLSDLFDKKAQVSYAELFPIFMERKRTHLDSIEREAMEIYRREMKNVLVEAQGSKKFKTNHEAAQRSATEHMKKKTSHLKIQDDVKHYLTVLKKLIKQEEQEFSAQNIVRLNVTLESIKIVALAGFDKEMGQWMRENSNLCDMKKLKNTHDAALNRALSEFSSKTSLDSNDEIFRRFFTDVKSAISEKMRDNKEILQKTGMQQSMSLTLQKYKSGMEAVGTKTRYVGNLVAQHLKVEAEAIQFLTDLLDNAEKREEALDEARKLINEAFDTYSEVNNAMRSQHFSAIYENFERDLKLELTSLRDAIRTSWQKNIQQRIDEVTEICLRVILDQNDGSPEYSNLLAKSKDHIKEINVDLLSQNKEKMKTELEAANNAVEKANEVYMTAMNKNIIALSEIPEEAQITTFHEPAKKEALDSYYKLIAPLKVAIPPENLPKLQKAILDALEKFKIDNNLKRREKRTNKNQSGHPVGIDLGTTYSCVALYRNGIFERIKSSYDSYTTPSVVYYGPNLPFVGEAAVLKGQTDFGNCISGVKRIIGRPYTDPEVQAFKRNAYFEIVCRDGLPSIQVSRNGRNECLKVEEVSAEVLREMKHQASRHLKYEVKDAVVTVPAYFTEPQRAATLEACRLADINVLRLLNEPTAAALAFGTQHQDKSLRRVLVFDFGGGTCDVSVLEVRGDDFVVKASRGDNTLGGRDLDQRLLEFVLECHQLSGKSLDRSTKSRILYECEKVKRSLSDKLEEKMYLAKVDGSELRLDITRADFERIGLDLLEKALIPVEDCLKAANLIKIEIDEIVLAGGSSHIPKMKELLTEFFGGKKLHEGINPDEAIAHGAALQAAIITKDPKLKTTIKEITPHSLGIGVLHNKYSIIIPKDSHIPCQHTERYCTAYDNQTAISNKIYQGENPAADKNTLLGQFRLTNIRVAAAGEIKEDVTFKIDENGILHVEAQEVSNTKSNVESITINRKVI